MRVRKFVVIALVTVPFSTVVAQMSSEEAYRRLAERQAMRVSSTSPTTARSLKSRSVNAPDVTNLETLFAAAKENRLADVEAQLNAGTPADAVDGARETA